MANKQEIIDKGWDHYISEIEKKSTVNVGVTQADGMTKFTSEGKQSTIGLAHLAFVHEYGTTMTVTERQRTFMRSKGLNLGATLTIPSRPFMRQAFDGNLEQLKSLVDKKQLEIIEKKKTAEQVLEEIGIVHKSQIQDTMINGEFKSNHPFTIAEKGSDKPLIDTGRLVGSIDFEVE